MKVRELIEKLKTTLESSVNIEIAVAVEKPDGFVLYKIDGYSVTKDRSNIKQIWLSI